MSWIWKLCISLSFYDNQVTSSKRSSAFLAANVHSSAEMFSNGSALASTKAHTLEHSGYKDSKEFGSGAELSGITSRTGGANT